MARKRDFIGIYKANKSQNGAVAQFKLASERTDENGNIIPPSCMFMELAKQYKPMNDSAPYDWTNTKITVKLGEADIGKLLALFNGSLPLNADPKKEDLMLYHQNQNGNKIIKFKKQDRGYYMKVSIKEGSRTDSIALPIAWEEVELLKIGLSKAYGIILDW